MKPAGWGTEVSQRTAPTPKFPGTGSATDTRPGHSATPPGSHLVAGAPPSWFSGQPPPTPASLQVAQARGVVLEGRMRRRLFPGDPAAGWWTLVFTAWLSRARAPEEGGACAG